MKIKMVYVTREDDNFQWERVLIPKEISNADIACFFVSGGMLVLYIALALCIVGGIGYQLFLFMKSLF